MVTVPGAGTVIGESVSEDLGEQDAALWAGWRVFAELTLMGESEVPAALTRARELAVNSIGGGLRACDWWMALTLVRSSVQ
jgi:hypothetical protein